MLVEKQKTQKEFIRIQRHENKRITALLCS